MSGQSIAPEDQHYTDSLEALVAAARSDTVQAELLNTLSDYWSEKDTGRALHYARQALNHSRGHRYLTAEAHFYLAGAYFSLATEKSQAQYQEVIDLLRGDSSRRALILSSRSWHNYGALLQRQGDDKAFMKILLDHAIPLAAAAKDTLRQGFSYYSVAQIFANVLDYDKAIHYYKQALQLLTLLHPAPRILASCYTDLAKNYLYKHQYPAAKPWLDSTQKILKGYPLFFAHMDYNRALGMYYADIGEWEPAFAHLDTALAQARQLGLPYEANGVLFQKYKAYTRAERFAEAKKILLKVYRDSLSSARPANRLMFLYNLAQTDARLNQMQSAYHWLSLYARLSDSLHTEQTKADIADMELKYESEKKQRQILSLQNKNKQQQLHLQHTRLVTYLLVGGVLFLLLISTFVFLLYRNKKRSARKDARLHDQKLQQMEQEVQLKMYNAMLEGQDLERKRMARDLHDGLGGQLAGIKLKLSDLAADTPMPSDQALLPVIRQLDTAVQELRQIARNMMPESLIRFGLETALKDLCDALVSTSLQVEFQAYHLRDDMPRSVQLNIYRIVQELLSNTVRHAHAHTVLVQCSQNGARVFLTVEDDGIGFDPAAQRREKGIGLANIQNRIHFLRGKLDIQSQPGEGTIVNVEVDDHE